MRQRRSLRRIRTPGIGVGRRLLLPGWAMNLSQKGWFRASPIFFIGTVVTAAGTTMYKNDMAIFIGMVVMALGVVAMFLAEAGKRGFKAFPGPLIFIAGSVLTAMSMTVSPSNMLLCIGMILAGLGTLLMWLVLEAKLEPGAIIVAILFTGGITVEAVSLTLVPSDLLVMIGMIATGIGAFAMWAYETSHENEEEEEASD